MDNIFEILLRNNELTSLGFQELKVSWNNEIYSQDPKKYKWGELLFTENSDMDYYNDLVGDMVNVYQYTPLTLDYNTLKKIELEVNRANFNDSENELFALVKRLYSNSQQFCFLNLADEERVDHKYVLGNATDAINILRNSLLWSSAEGIAVVRA